MDVVSSYLPQGAAVTAVVAVVVLFLKHIRDFNGSLHELARQCHTHQEQAQKSFERSLDRIVSSSEKNTDRIIEQLTKVQDNQLEIVEKIRSNADGQ